MRNSEHKLKTYVKNDDRCLSKDCWKLGRYIANLVCAEKNEGSPTRKILYPNTAMLN